MSGRQRASHEHCASVPAPGAIDTVAAVQSVVEAAGVLRPGPGRRGDRPGGTLTETAVRLAMAGHGQPHAARSVVDRIRDDPRSAARAYGCTLGAVLVWRAVDRAERAGLPAPAAAAAGVGAAVDYLDLLPARQFTAAGIEPAERRALIADVERQARLALSEAGARTA